MELPLYEYQLLRSGQIRVLELPPDSMSRMKHIDLKKAFNSSRYFALSYTWGSNTETFPFTCDARNLPVRQNLLQALSRLKNFADGPIWIDAMCINQSNEKERMAQIQMMTDIYKKAKRVIIWLGEEVLETETTVKRLRDVTTALKTLKTADSNIESILPPSFIAGIRHLLTCAWWSRLWVLQEATLAREAMFICGSHIIPWKDLSALTKQIKRHGLYRLFRGHEQRAEYCGGFTELLNVELVRHTHSANHGPDLLRTCRQRICFDPCDRVYGVIGLMPTLLSGAFKWEPGEQVEQLYPPFVAILLIYDPVATLLSLNETTQRNFKLPSWCPDLHYRSRSDVLADYDGYHAGFNIQTTTKFKFDQNDWTRVQTKGIAADIVKMISPEEWMDEGGNQVENSTDLSAQQHNVMLLQRYSPVADKLVKSEDLWRIFVGNQIGGRESKLHLLAGFSSLHDRVVRSCWKTEAEGYQNAFLEVQAYMLSPNTNSELSASIQIYLEAARKVCFGRKFFTTENGRVGLGPQKMEAGDVVCILKCVRVPFVLRKHELEPQTYYLIGEAYVHGLMQGEYLKNNKNFHWITLA